MSETKKPQSAEQLLFDAACKCMSPDQMDKFEALQKSDAGFSLRFLNSILDQFGYEPAAHMVRHVNFRGDEMHWRNLEPAFLHQYRADRDYEVRPVYVAPVAAINFALGELVELERDWDTGAAFQHAESDRLAMEGACERVRNALIEARNEVTGVAR